MKTYVYEGYISELDGDTFYGHLKRNGSDEYDDEIIAEFHKDEVDSKDCEYIQLGVCFTWYVTEKGTAIRFRKTVIMPSDIKRADMLSREWCNVFRMPDEFS